MSKNIFKNIFLLVHPFALYLWSFSSLRPFGGGSNLVLRPPLKSHNLIFSLKYNWQYIEKAPAICLIEKPQYWLLSKRIDLCTYRVWASWRLCAGSGARWCTAGRRGSRRPGSRRRPRGCPGCTGTRTCKSDDLFRCTSLTTPKNERAYKESPPGAASWLELVQLFQTSDISPELISCANGLRF